MQTFSTRSWLGHNGFRASIGIAILACGSLVVAQNAPYTQPEPDNDKKNLRFTAAQVLGGQKPLGGSEQVLRDYFTEFYFPAMAAAVNRSPTVTSRGLPGSVAYLRRRLAKDLRRANNGEARNFVNKLALAEMPKYVTQNYHPTVRINGALLIGDLDGRPATGRDASAGPIPEALPVLLRFLEQDLPDAVQAATLVGVRRHAESDLAAAARGQVTAAMLTIVGSDEPPVGRSDDGHAWIRRQAAEVLGILGEVGTGQQVYASLESVLNDQTVPIWLRCSAAESLGQLSYGENSPVDTSALVVSLGKCATDAVKQSVARSAGLPRRALAYYTQCVRRALESVQSAASDSAAQRQAKTLVGMLDGLGRALENELQGSAQLASLVTKMGRDMENVLLNRDADPPDVANDPAEAAPPPDPDELEAALDNFGSTEF